MSTTDPPLWQHSCYIASMMPLETLKTQRLREQRQHLIHQRAFNNPFEFIYSASFIPIFSVTYVHFYDLKRFIVIASHIASSIFFPLCPFLLVAFYSFTMAMYTCKWKFHGNIVLANHHSLFEIHFAERDRKRQQSKWRWMERERESESKSLATYGLIKIMTFKSVPFYLN